MSEIRLAKYSSNFSYNEAKAFKTQIIDTWKPETEIWALKHGDGMLGGLSGAGGVLITYLFRRELKILPYARLTCHIPVMGIASLACFFGQEAFVTTEILLSNKCPLCLTARANSIQLGIGIGYTLLAATNVCFYMADRLLTYPVPPLARAPKEVFNLAKKIIMKHRKTIFVIGALEMIAASFITYQKQNSLIKLDEKFKPRAETQSQVNASIN